MSKADEMNKEIEEAIKDCEEIIKSNNAVIKEARKKGDINVMQLTASLDRESKAIETVLNYIKDSIPNSVIREKIENLNFSGGNDGKDEIENQIRQFTIEILEETLKEGEKR